MSARFTIDGNPSLEQQLEAISNAAGEQIRAVVPGNQLEAIFLGGGYGRGEGGVLKTPEGDRPYNDMEFYICLRGNPRLNERTFGERFHHIAEHLSEKAGIEVEFKIASLEKIRTSAPSMFLYDLAVGHKTVLGNDEVLRLPKFQDPANIPMHEATRLLMNRCSGLLFAEEKLQHDPFTPADADFVGRNQAKAQLAFGDIVLTVLGQYHWSCRERHQRLQRIAEGTSLSGFPASLKKIVCHHALGVEFKLHPKKMNGMVTEFLPLQAELREIGKDLWLWLESRRLGTTFTNVEAYAFSDANKCPETNPLKNRLINLKHFGPGRAISARGGRYPRERMLQALPLLLWEQVAQKPGSGLVKVQEQLNTAATDFPGLVDAYFCLWRNFN